MSVVIEGLTVKDIRFPTSRALDGSDAMNADPDYSAAYVILHTRRGGLEGHGLTFLANYRVDTQKIDELVAKQKKTEKQSLNDNKTGSDTQNIKIAQLSKQEEQSEKSKSSTKISVRKTKQNKESGRKIAKSEDIDKLDLLARRFSGNYS